jgi:hypothetical protein
MFHVQYILECLGKCTQKVRNIKAYLLTTIYNAVLTMDAYYRSEVNHDFARSEAKDYRSRPNNSRTDFIQGNLADDLQLIEELSIKSVQEASNQSLNAFIIRALDYLIEAENLHPAEDDS